MHHHGKRTFLVAFENVKVHKPEFINHFNNASSSIIYCDHFNIHTRYPFLQKQYKTLLPQNKVSVWFWTTFFSWQIYKTKFLIHPPTFKQIYNQFFEATKDSDHLVIIDHIKLLAYYNMETELKNYVRYREQHHKKTILIVLFNIAKDPFVLKHIYHDAYLKVPFRNNRYEDDRHLQEVLLHF